jgi:hypothetical protein
MPLTPLQRLRQRVQDEPRRVDAVYQGDGRAAAFALPHTHLTSGSAFVPAAPGWSATAATFDPSGVVTFANPISANSAFRVVYVHSVFSDSVLEDYASAYGDAAALQCAYDLLFDATKRARWAAAGASYDDTEARLTVRDLISALKAELTDQSLHTAALHPWPDGE